MEIQFQTDASTTLDDREINKVSMESIQYARQGKSFMRKSFSDQQSALMPYLAMCDDTTESVSQTRRGGTCDVMWIRRRCNDLSDLLLSVIDAAVASSYYS
jgi:hypothetical protein